METSFGRSPFRVQNPFCRPIQEIDLSVKIDREQAAVQALDHISVEGLQLIIVDLFLDEFLSLFLRALPQ